MTDKTYSLGPYYQFTSLGPVPAGAVRPMPLRRRITRAATPEVIAELTGRILAIRSTITSGVESAAYGDKRTEFRSLSELREILNALEEELADLLGLAGAGRMRQIRMTNQWDKGL